MADLPRLPQVAAVRRDDNRVELDLVIQPELFWFQGHFPNFPILPGVIQLDWAMEFARQSLGLEIEVARQFQAKYKSGIFAGDHVTLTLTYLAEKNRLSFDYVRAGAVCSSGQINTAVATV